MKPAAKTTKEIQKFLKHEIKLIKREFRFDHKERNYAKCLESQGMLLSYEFLLEWTSGVHG